MELDDFVKETLLGISRGVKSAMDVLPSIDSSASVNPTFQHSLRAKPQDVAFDIAVTAASAKEGSTGGGLKIVVAEFGGKGAMATSEERVNRVRFTVPLAMPHTPSAEFRESSRSIQTDSDYDPVP